MKQTLFIKLSTLISLLFSFAILAAPVGESAGEIWVDGPADKQPGSDPSYPDAAVDNSGRSIFVWKAFSSATRTDIFLRLFDIGGSPLGDPVLVNTLVEDDQTFPRVAVSSNQSFLVVWQSDEPDPNVTVDRKWVRSRAFNAGGDPVGLEQLLSEHSSGEATDVNADVAALRDGGYVVVWRSRPADGSGAWDIWARRVGADGAPLDVQFIANSSEDSHENYPAVTELADGGFLVTWTIPEVHGRRFTADGTPVGDDFQINTLVDGGEQKTDAVLHEDGRVFVVWDSAISAGNDVEPPSIEGRIVSGSAQFAGPQFLVNQWTESIQQLPGIGGSKGRIAVGWHAKSNPDTTVNVINGQFWSICGIFCDGFE